MKPEKGEGVHPRGQDNREDSAHSESTGEDEVMGEQADEDSLDDDNDVYVVDRIVGHRKAKGNASYEYRVRWEGYGRADDTWEPHDNIAESAAPVIDAYWEPFGGYEVNKNATHKQDKNKRKRQSREASPPLAHDSRHRRTVVLAQDANDTASAQEVSASPSAEPIRAWRPPLEMQSWEEDALVETLEKDAKNELYVLLEWPETKGKSRHKADLVYKKMPQAMLRFYEANLVFKTAK